MIQSNILTSLMFSVAKRWIRPPNAQWEVSNTNNFGSVSDSLGRLAAASECMAMIMKLVVTQSTNLLIVLRLIVHSKRLLHQNDG